jgi:hypothetical protein
MMQRVYMLRIVGVLAFLGVASLTIPLSAHAGGVQVSIGIGLPLPVTVVPAPVVVAPRPVIVYPAPVVVAPPPVVIAPLRVGHPHRLPPGIAKKYSGDHPKHKHWKQPRRW